MFTATAGYAAWRYFHRQPEKDSKTTARPIAQTDQPLETLDQQQVEQNPRDAAKRQGLSRKRIIICCDGTWQTSATGRKNVPSNVTRLARSIAHNKNQTGSDDGNSPEEDFQQIVYYSPGIGTGDGVNILEKTRQATFGDGLVSDVIKAYSFVVMNYSPLDEIYCFGFSRGAYTARAVAGLITDIGIIKPQELDDFPELYALYRKCGNNDSFRFRQSPEYRQWIMGVRKKGFEYLVQNPEKPDNNWTQVPHSLPPEFTRVIQVVGVFDTVGALGIPYMGWTQGISNYIAGRLPFLGIDAYGFHNPSLSRYIKNAFHALALDDKKTAFCPTLWRLPGPGQQAPYPTTETREALAERLRNLLNARQPDETEINTAWSDLVECEMADQLQVQKDGQLEYVKPNLQQVWFPGSHQNIGGGNPGILLGAPFDCEQLALVTFTWMCDQVSPFLQFNDEQIAANANHPQILSTLADREILSRKKLIEFSHQSQGLHVSSFVKLARQVLSRLRWVKTGEDNQEWALGPIIGDTSVVQGGLLISFLFRSLFALIFGFLFRFLLKDRTPGLYNRPDGHQNDAGITNERVHPAVRYRMDNDPSYKPGALKDFQKPITKKKGPYNDNKYVWRSRKSAPSLQEYIIKPEDRISRELANRSTIAKQFISAL
ncbi:hypothetical protein K4K58_002432 [Colletotrichum sp. SAR11_239]|nr:hypothetical protein K4K58_002432 [Colletotrichum sp. SAR11_239]